MKSVKEFESTLLSLDVFYECLIELSSYGYVGTHLSRFQQLLVIVSLASCNMQKIAVFDPEVCRKSENWSTLSNQHVVGITVPALT